MHVYVHRERERERERYTLLQHFSSTAASATYASRSFFFEKKKRKKDAPFVSVGGVLVAFKVRALRYLLLYYVTSSYTLYYVTSSYTLYYVTSSYTRSLQSSCLALPVYSIQSVSLPLLSLLLVS